MYIVRFSSAGRVKYGTLEGNTIKGIKGSSFTDYKTIGSQLRFDGNIFKLDEARLLAPCKPSKIVCLGLNYKKHVEEMKVSPPPVPLIFLKPPSSVIGPDQEIVLPRNSGRVDYEGELAIVIGRKAKDVSEIRAKDYVMGYTCLNDISERHIQKADGQWTRAKGFDTFAPIGPWITTGIDPDSLKIETYLNGELRQSAYTSDLIFGVSKLISFISEAMTLLPGDIIATGTPSGVGQIRTGDIIEVKIEKIGTLRNSVINWK